MIITAISSFGFTICTCYAYSKLLSSMADSKLFPNFLSHRTSSGNLPLYALCFGQFVALILTIIGFMIPSITTAWPSIIGLFTFFTYVLQLIGFFSLRTKLNRFPREFSSPFGIIGAMYSLAVFIIGAITCIVDNYWCVIVAFIYVAIMSCYYECWARRRQTFSPAEKLVMLPVHAEIKNANGKTLYMP
jgi:amino acid transporter